MIMAGKRYGISPKGVAQFIFFPFSPQGDLVYAEMGGGLAPVAPMLAQCLHNGPDLGVFQGADVGPCRGSLFFGGVFKQFPG